LNKPSTGVIRDDSSEDEGIQDVIRNALM